MTRIFSLYIIFLEKQDKINIIIYATSLVSNNYVNWIKFTSWSWIYTPSHININIKIELTGKMVKKWCCSCYKLRLSACLLGSRISINGASLISEHVDPRDNLICRCAQKPYVSCMYFYTPFLRVLIRSFRSIKNRARRIRDNAKFTKRKGRFNSLLFRRKFLLYRHAAIASVTTASAVLTILGGLV